MLRPKLINLLTEKPAPRDYIYIGRAMSNYSLPESKWANPFKIARDEDRVEAIEKYREHLLNSPQLLRALPELAGQTIACWCTPKPCHGDILALFCENLRGPATKQMRAMCMDHIGEEDERKALAWAIAQDHLPSDVHDWNDAPIADCVKFILRDVGKREAQGTLF